jgi:hypothetical protein
MGRDDTRHPDPDSPLKFYLVRLKWVDGDYDEGGAYWGYSLLTGDIYRAVSTDGKAEMFVRARSRGTAKAAIREKYPHATFFR